jgi:hypothetical protein
MPDDIFQELQVVQIRGNPLRISRASKPPREGGSPIRAPREERSFARKPVGFNPGGPRKPHRKGPRV